MLQKVALIGQKGVVKECECFKSNLYSIFTPNFPSFSDSLIKSTPIDTKTPGLLIWTMWEPQMTPRFRGIFGRRAAYRTSNGWSQWLFLVPKWRLTHAYVYVYIYDLYIYMFSLIYIYIDHFHIKHMIYCTHIIYYLLYYISYHII